MPRLPESKRSASRRWAVGVATLAALAMAGLYLWLRSADDTADGSRLSLTALLSEAGRELRGAFSGSPGAPRAEPALPGSMQESLLNATDGHRMQLFWRAITDAGFECAEVRTAAAAGDTGSTWRANCGDSSIYLIEVDEFGRLAVVPMPYGDLHPASVSTSSPANESRIGFPSRAGPDIRRSN